MLTDRIVCWISNDNIQHRHMTEHIFTMHGPLNWVRIQAYREATESSRVLQYIVEPGNPSSPCYFYGKLGYLSTKYRFKAQTCYKCRKLGHFKIL